MIDDDLLKKAVLESYASIADQIDPSQEEKEKQETISNDIDDEGIRKKSSSKSEVDEEESSKEKNDNLDLVDKKEKGDKKFSYEIPEKMPKNVQFKDIVTQLNALRSGASLKDDKVKTGLLKYFDNLKSDEKQELFSMMSGFATIMNKAGGVEDAPMPDDFEKPNSKSDLKTQPTKTLSNSPIVVGEVSEKLKEAMIVLENTKSNHKCVSGKVVSFGSQVSVNDLEARIIDAQSSRDSCFRGTESRSSYNGLLKHLRMQLRSAQKVNGSKK